MIEVILWLLGLLPDSWFVHSEVSAQIAEYISYMNFFIPFDSAINITTAWLACIVAYIAYSLSINFISAIRDLM